MAGLRKAKQYDWKDSNLALFGSDLEKNIKKEAAQTEKAWAVAGKKVGLQIWRIVKFAVEEWPENQYGEFYNGDSYIILHTYKTADNDELMYDVHFWIGANSSQDEYGTAAYKTVELDIFLDDKPVQHRQVQGFETDKFKSYFKTIKILNGGAESGFRRVSPEAYKHRLLQIKIENRKGSVVEVPLKRSSMNNGDVFIFDKGLHLIQWTGKDASPFERNKASDVAAIIDAERNGKPKIEVLDDQDINDMPESLTALFRDEGSGNGPPPQRQPFEKKLNRLSDISGNLEFQEISSGSAVKRSQLNTNDVFILDTQKECFVWIGKGASIEERRSAFIYAHNYLMKSVNPFNPITVVDEDRESQAFNQAF